MDASCFLAPDQGRQVFEVMAEHCPRDRPVAGEQGKPRLPPAPGWRWPPGPLGAACRWWLRCPQGKTRRCLHPFYSGLWKDPTQTKSLLGPTSPWWFQQDLQQQRSEAGGHGPRGHRLPVRAPSPAPLWALSQDAGRLTLAAKGHFPAQLLTGRESRSVTAPPGFPCPREQGESPRGSALSPSVRTAHTQHPPARRLS